MALEKGLAVTGHEGNKEVVVATKGSTSICNGRTVLCLCRGASDPQMDGQFCAFAVVLDTQTHMGGKCHRTKHTHTQFSARDTGDIRTVCVDGRGQVRGYDFVLWFPKTGPLGKQSERHPDHSSAFLQLHVNPQLSLI